MILYNSVVATVNKIFTKSYGRHGNVEDIFDKVFFGGHFGDGKLRLNKNYRRKCMVKALRKFEELDNVQTISIEDAKKYIPAVVAEYEKFRNDYVEKYFGTWENMKNHYAEVKKERERYIEQIRCNVRIKEVAPKSKFNFDFTPMIKAAMAN